MVRESLATGSREDFALAPQAWFESQENSEMEHNEVHPEKLWLASAFVVLLPGSKTPATVATKAPTNARDSHAGGGHSSWATRRPAVGFFPYLGFVAAEG